MRGRDYGVANYSPERKKEDRVSITAKHAYGASIDAVDGQAGTLYDVLFDDQTWRVRHLVVSTERWFHGRQVLIAPEVVAQTDWPGQRMSVRLTKQQVMQSPRAETDLPVARRKNQEAARMLVWEAYLMGIPDAPAEARGDQHLAARKCSSAFISTARRLVGPCRRLHYRRRSMANSLLGRRNAQLVAGQAGAGRIELD